MDDDQYCPAIGVVHDFVTAINRLINAQDFVLTDRNYSFVKKADALFTEFLEILGLNIQDDAQMAEEGVYEPLIELLLESRRWPGRRKTGP